MGDGAHKWGVDIIPDIHTETNDTIQTTIVPLTEIPMYIPEDTPMAQLVLDMSRRPTLDCILQPVCK